MTAFFTVQLSHPYMTTRKTIALTRWTFFSKAMSLLFNMLSRLVIAFLPRSKRLNFMAAVTMCSDFGAKENKFLLFELPSLWYFVWSSWQTNGASYSINCETWSQTKIKEYSGSWWWTGRPGVLRFMGSQRVGHDWATELNWKYFWGLRNHCRWWLQPWN